MTNDRPVPSFALKLPRRPCQVRSTQPYNVPAADPVSPQIKSGTMDSNLRRIISRMRYLVSTTWFLKAIQNHFFNSCDMPPSLYHVMYPRLVA